MKIVTIGRGNIGGGLAALWRAAGHEVTELGRDGGDAAGADVVLVAVPGGSIGEALGRVEGLDGVVAIDATNAFGERNEAFASLAHEVKSFTGGPVAKAFNTNFAVLYPEVAKQRLAPTNLYAADDGARAAAEQLSRDAGYEPLSIGGLENARLLEDHLGLVMAVNRAGLGQFLYRYARPGEL